MKLPLIRSTAAKLEAAQAARTAAQEKLTALEAQRAAALVDADDVTALVQLSASIAQQQAIIRDCDDRIQALTVRLQQEAAEQRQRDYAAAIGRLEATLPARVRAAEKLEKAVVAVAVAYREFVDASDTTRKNWPAGAFFGFSHIEASRAGGLIAAAFLPGAASGSVVRRVGGETFALRHADFASHLATCDARAGGFAAAEQSRHETLIADLREAGPAHRESADDLAA